MQTKSVVERVTSLVPQDAHAFNFGATLDLAHELALELHQPRMREIKRYCESRHAVGREPFRREPDVGLEANATIVQLAVETLDVRFEKRSLDLNRQVADTRVKQPLI